MLKIVSYFHLAAVWAERNGGEERAWTELEL